MVAILHMGVQRRQLKLLFYIFLKAVLMPILNLTILQLVLLLKV